MLRKILIANRGEIAVRIIRACTEMGIRSVAVYSDADRFGLHVKKADESYCIGNEPVASYLNIHALVDLAAATGCDGIHPGYGFLSENAQFARVCKERGITFIGPEADVIHRMGDKTEARKAMIAAGIPVTPGSDGNLDSVEHALTVAEKIGYPVILKATSGGGGRGIRRCDNAEELQKNYQRVISEATKAFGSADVFLEKCVVNPKHIEVQVLADHHGNTIHLYERDCSIQRRNQKLIEIAPSPQLDEAQRQYIGGLAVLAAKAVGYTNAGTVEFLVDDKERFYFMEMNTRVQVEHTITETITGVDIVEEQIRVAAGLTLRFKQHEIVRRGYAMQFRVNAEDPKNSFLPSFGRITRYYALDKLREALDLLETHLDEREFERASRVGYNEVAHNFVYVQRTLAGLQTSVFQKESLISGIAQKARTAYEDVALFVEKKMQSSIKKSELSDEELLKRHNFVLDAEQWCSKFQKELDDPK